MIRAIPLLLVAILGALSNACRSRVAPTDHQDSDIYTVVIDSLFGDDATSLRGIVLGDSTEQYLREQLVPEFWSEFDSLAHGDAALVRDFERRSRTRSALRPRESVLKAELKTQFTFASDADFRRVRTVADSLRKASAPTFLSSADAYWQ